MRFSYAAAILISSLWSGSIAPVSAADVMAPSHKSTAIRARELTGVRVYNPSHENLGAIEDLVIDPAAGKIRYAVLSFGGVLGIGDKLFAVPWDELKLVEGEQTSVSTPKADHYVLNIRKDALQNAPGFDKSNWPDFSAPQVAQEIDKFYTTHRVAEKPGETMKK